ncbi:unnamed protein product [Vitrella brassicaformis CCMP3155]|uniref:Uncharacterized protein n=3 Tax=Vitrella brassicaformis TaxID=1169539 RepID=A0A0G4EQ20_VITBC|nr:unnamed protein product [Vitrella brassicaformis CCMP3155]|eukprot:CEL99497.1 unnamed protein product [Vitrella brassicaformis CCMP3155]
MPLGHMPHDGARALSSRPPAQSKTTPIHFGDNRPLVTRAATEFPKVLLHEEATNLQDTITVAQPLDALSPLPPPPQIDAADTAIHQTPPPTRLAESAGDHRDHRFSINTLSSSHSRHKYERAMHELEEEVESIRSQRASAMAIVERLSEHSQNSAKRDEGLRSLREERRMRASDAPAPSAPRRSLQAHQKLREDMRIPLKAKAAARETASTTAKPVTAPRLAKTAPFPVHTPPTNKRQPSLPPAPANTPNISRSRTLAKPIPQRMQPPLSVVKSRSAPLVPKKQHRHDEDERLVFSFGSTLKESSGHGGHKVTAPARNRHASAPVTPKPTLLGGGREILRPSRTGLSRHTPSPRPIAPPKTKTAHPAVPRLTSAKMTRDRTPTSTPRRERSAVTAVGAASKSRSMPLGRGKRLPGSASVSRSQTPTPRSTSSQRIRNAAPKKRTIAAQPSSKSAAPPLSRPASRPASHLPSASLSRTPSRSPPVTPPKGNKTKAVKGKSRSPPPAPRMPRLTDARSNNLTPRSTPRSVTPSSGKGSRIPSRSPKGDPRKVARAAKKSPLPGRRSPGGVTPPSASLTPRSEMLTPRKAPQAVVKKKKAVSVKKRATPSPPRRDRSVTPRSDRSRRSATPPGSARSANKAAAGKASRLKAAVTKGKVPLWPPAPEKPKPVVQSVGVGDWTPSVQQGVQVLPGGAYAYSQTMPVWAHTHMGGSNSPKGRISPKGGRKSLRGPLQGSPAQSNKGRREPEIPRGTVVSEKGKFPSFSKGKTETADADADGPVAQEIECALNPQTQPSSIASTPVTSAAFSPASGPVRPPPSSVPPLYIGPPPLSPVPSAHFGPGRPLTPPYFPPSPPMHSVRPPFPAPPGTPPPVFTPTMPIRMPLPPGTMTPPPSRVQPPPFPPPPSPGPVRAQSAPIRTRLVNVSSPTLTPPRQPPLPSPSRSPSPLVARVSLAAAKANPLNKLTHSPAGAPVLVQRPVTPKLMQYTTNVHPYGSMRPPLLLSPPRPSTPTPIVSFPPSTGALVPMHHHPGPFTPPTFRMAHPPHIPLPSPIGTPPPALVRPLPPGIAGIATPPRLPAMPGAPAMGPNAGAFAPSPVRLRAPRPMIEPVAEPFYQGTQNILKQNLIRKPEPRPQTLEVPVGDCGPHVVPNVRIHRQGMPQRVEQLGSMHEYEGRRTPKQERTRSTTSLRQERRTQDPIQVAVDGGCRLAVSRCLGLR